MPAPIAGKRRDGNATGAVLACFHIGTSTEAEGVGCFGADASAWVRAVREARGTCGGFWVVASDAMGRWRNTLLGSEALSDPMARQ